VIWFACEDLLSINSQRQGKTQAGSLMKNLQPTRTLSLFARDRATFARFGSCIKPAPIFTKDKITASASLPWALSTVMTWEQPFRYKQVSQCNVHCWESYAATREACICDVLMLFVPDTARHAYDSSLLFCLICVLNLAYACTCSSEGQRPSHRTHWSE